MATVCRDTSTTACRWVGAICSTQPLLTADGWMVFWEMWGGTLNMKEMVVEALEGYPVCWSWSGSTSQCIQLAFGKLSHALAL